MRHSHTRLTRLHQPGLRPDLLRLSQLRFRWKPAAVIFISALILSYDHYRDLFSDPTLNGLALYLALPLVVILAVFRESPGRYGFCLGDWKAGIVLTAIGILGVSLLVPFVAQLKDFRAYYSPVTEQFLPLLIHKSLSLVGWEFLFRGFLLFALLRIAGPPYAIFLQAVPFTLAHFGKPELETLSCMFGGSLFGYVAWRTDSFLYPFLIHTYLSVLIVLLC